MTQPSTQKLGISGRKKSRVTPVLASSAPDMPSSLAACRKLGGNLTVVESRAQQSELITFYNRLYPNETGIFGGNESVARSVIMIIIMYSGEFWTGLTDREEDGNFVNIITGAPVPKEVWSFFAGEPNGEK